MSSGKPPVGDGDREGIGAHRRALLDLKDDQIVAEYIKLYPPPYDRKLILEEYRRHAKSKKDKDAEKDEGTTPGLLDL